MNSQEASKYLQAIADPNRLTIIKKLTTNLHMCASDFLDIVSCKQATLSHHLNELVEVGLLNAKKKGTKVFYCLDALTYSALVNFFGKIDRVNKTTDSTKKEIYRVVDSEIIDKKDSKKEKLPTFLL